MSDHDNFFSAVTALGGLDVLDADGMRLLYRVERTGEDFSNLIADRIGDPRAADLLRKNAREERGHAERVRRALGVKLGTPWQPTAEDDALYDVPLPDAIPVALFPQIVQGEIDGDAGYQKWADRESDPEVQRLLRLNGREETVHGQRVSEVIAILEVKGA
jgi:rubrerythrin